MQLPLISSGRLPAHGVNGSAVPDASNNLSYPVLHYLVLCVLHCLFCAVLSCPMLQSNGSIVEIEPLCVLDFYVHEDHQRQGVGRALFEVRWT